MDTQTFFYIVGGGLCLVALAISFVGMRSESFPPSKRTVLGGLAIVFLIVATACTGAVIAAREEQKHRRAEFAHLAAEEAAHEGAEDGAPTAEGGAPAEPAEPAAPAPEEPEEPAAPAPAEPETASIDAAGLFVSNGCGSCHTFAAAGSEAAVGPNLDEVLPGQSPEAVAESIADPGAQVAEGFGDGIMPTNFGTAMSEAEIEALVAYLLENAG